ncbi:hypothetical protein [Undibacterium sp. Ren11W]|uniref:hypothetical protein n=1 Tax=Undibacterium sp. Ren11W TaxID=3413045 RepID=UPI003BEFF2BD
MYLSDSNTLSEAAEWLTENKYEPWTWRNVIEKYAEMHSATINVVIPCGARLTKLSPGEVMEIDFLDPCLLEVCNVESFLEDILLGNNLENACARPLALVSSDGSLRYHSVAPIRASAIRLNKMAILRLADLPPLDPFRFLVNDMTIGLQDNLAKLVRNHKKNVETPPGEVLEETLISSQVSIEIRPTDGEVPIPLQPSPVTALKEIDTSSKALNIVPKGGDTLTPLVWKICNDLYNDGTRHTTVPVMRKLKILADSDNKEAKYPLLSSIAGGVKYDDGLGDEQELNAKQLRERIKEWKKGVKKELKTRHTNQLNVDLLYRIGD